MTPNDDEVFALAGFDEAVRQLRVRPEQVGRGVTAALEVAALLPPDKVPWSWVKFFVRKLVPETMEASPFFPEGDWPEVRHILQEHQLLTPTDHPELAQIHPLLADEVRPAPEAEVVIAVWYGLLERTDFVEEMLWLPDWEWQPLIQSLDLIVRSSPPTIRTQYAAELMRIGEGWLIEAEKHAKADVAQLIVSCNEILEATKDETVPMLPNTSPGRLAW